MSVPPHGELLVGPDSLRDALEDVARRHRRLLVVCGGRSFERSGAGELITELPSTVAVRRWSGVSPDPSHTELHEGLDIADEFRPDAILGVGGGSVMDLAKLVRAFGSRPSLSDLERVIRDGVKTEPIDASLMLVPTTAGSGSEATHFAVVYIGDEKYSVAGPALRADSVALDPRLICSGPASQRATSAIDAVCQAIESRWATGRTPESAAFAEQALGLLMPAIEKFVAGDDAQASAMQVGSYLAGRAIDISKTTGAHALAYGITKRFEIPHGNAVALTLGAFIAAHGRSGVSLQDGLSRSSHENAIRSVLRHVGGGDGSDAAARFRELLVSIGLLERMSAIPTFTRAEIPSLVAGVNLQRLANNPVRFDEEGLRSILAESV